MNKMSSPSIQQLKAEAQWPHSSATPLPIRSTGECYCSHNTPNYWRNPKCILKAVRSSPCLRLNSKPPFPLSCTLQHSPVSLLLHSCPCYPFSIQSSGVLENMQSTRISAADNPSWLPMGLEGKSPPSRALAPGPITGPRLAFPTASPGAGQARE